MSQTPGRDGGPYVLGIDYGTESCRVRVFDTGGRPLALAATPYQLTHPRPGWAEQDPGEWCRRWSARFARRCVAAATATTEG
jgi:sugar (pentulose or hexulose) kinase